MQAKIRYLERIQDSSGQNVFPTDMNLRHCSKAIEDYLTFIHCQRKEGSLELSSVPVGIDSSGNEKQSPWSKKSFYGEKFLFDLVIGPNTKSHNLVYLGLLICGNIGLIDRVEVGVTKSIQSHKDKGLELFNFGSRKDISALELDDKFHFKYKTVCDILQRSNIDIPYIFNRP